MNAPFEIAGVGGVPFQVTTLPEAVRWMCDVAAVEHLPLNVRLANSWTVALANRDENYRALLANEGVNLPDGVPVAWFMNRGRKPGRAVASRVRGPSFFTAVMEAGLDSGLRHYLLGASPETLELLKQKLESRYPDIEIVGHYSPPFAPISEGFLADCASRIQGSGADLVWVGLGTPKQDYVGTALAPMLGVTTVSVGAAFDFFAGTVAEAPLWVQESGFEWLFRLLSEPRRLWRRYLIGNFQFVWAAARSYRSDRTSNGG